MSYIAKLVCFVTYSQFKPSTNTSSTQKLKCKQQYQSHELNSSLPMDFAQQILNNEIVFFLSEYTNNESLKNLIQLYMKGVEFYQDQGDMAEYYFKSKLDIIYKDPLYLSSQQSTRVNTKQSTTPPQKQKILVPKIQVNIEKPKTQAPRTANIARKSTLLTFNYPDPTDDQVDKIYQPVLKDVQQEHHQVKKSNDNSNDNYDQGERLPSHQDEMRENMEETIKQELFLVDTNSKAKEMQHQYLEEKKKLNKLIGNQIETQDQRLKARIERRRTQTNLSNHMNRTYSHPLLEQTPQHNKNSAMQQQQCIKEETNEMLSSKLPSAEKGNEIQQFNFEENH